MRMVEGAPLDVPDATLASMLFDRIREHGDRPGFMVKRNGRFETMPWREVGERVRHVAHGLMTLGLKPGDAVAVLSNTRHEWSLADFGILAAGGVTVTIYPTLPADQVLFLLKDAGVRFVFVEDDAQYEKAKTIADDADGVEGWIAFEKVEVADGALGKRTHDFGTLLEQGRVHAEKNPQAVDERVAAVKPDDVSTIIYTSGTTGVPKGAVLTHRNWIAASRMLVEFYGLREYRDPRIVAFLPLAHVMTRILQIVFTDIGGAIAFGNPRTLGDDLQQVQPNLTVSVPRVYERMFDQIRKAVAEQPEKKRRIFARAEALAMEWGKASSNGGVPPLGMRLQHTLFDFLVYSKLRQRLGFSRLEAGLSSAAAIRPDLLYFLVGIGLNIGELWGMTEMAGPGTGNPRDRFKPGTVGCPLPGTTVALDEEGEILLSGPNVFVGYHNRPDENAECLVEIGGRRWIRTGDVGEFDEDGYLRIVDRKKEIEVLDTGKKIAPITVEERLKSVSPFVMEACLVGTGRKFAGALVQPNFDTLVAWARERGIPFDASRVVVMPDPTGQPMTYSVGEDLLAHPDVQELFAGEVEKCNARCADFERIRVFRLVPNVFSMDRDELTPTLKKKRRVIKEHYAALVDEMFEAPNANARG